MNKKEILSSDYSANLIKLDNTLKTKQSFDIIHRSITIGDRESSLFFIDGFAKDDIMEKILEFLMSVKPDEIAAINNATEFSNKHVSYIETTITSSIDDIVTAVLSGTLVLVIDTYAEAILIDARTYPSRGVEEPDDDKVLRGSHDGFTETLIHNTALLRRRFRTPELTMHIMAVGKKSKTDVVLCYLDNLVDKKMLKIVIDKINKIDVNTLAMSQESIAEAIVARQWYNPFPKLRYTERPDVASANVAEGKIILLTDNSPSAMILPTGFFDFLQDANDFYFPPLVGSYLQLVRIAVFILTIFLTPVWYLLIKNPDYIPSWLDFIKIAEPNPVPVILQLLIIEFIIDGLKLASLNTPSVLGNSFSLVGAMILGDFAVKARWFVPEVMLYMAFVAILNFTQPSFELAYAFKLCRVLILILTALFNIWGFAGGIIIMLLLIATTKTVTGRKYLYPLIPFKPKEFFALFIRRPISKRDT